MPYVIRSAVNVRQPTPKQLRSPFWSFEPRVTGIPLHPGASIVLEDEVYRTNETTLKQMVADDLITVSGDSAPVSVVEAAPTEPTPTEAPPEVAAAAEEAVAKEFEAAVAATPEPAPEPVAEQPAAEKASKKSGGRKG